MEKSAYVYLNSGECRTEFPRNNANSFENRVQNLNLDPSKEYECSLIHIVHPRQYVVISTQDPDTHYEVKVIKQGHGPVYVGSYADIEKYRPKGGGDIKSRDMAEVCKAFNRMLGDSIGEAVKNVHFHYLRGDAWPIISYDHEKNVVIFKRFHTKLRGGQDGGSQKHVRRIEVRFCDKIARVFGFNSNTWMTLYEHNPTSIDNTSEFTPRNLRSSHVMYVYSDIVKPVRYAQSQINILNITEAAVAEDDKTFASPIVYVPINKTNIETIGILLTDDEGRLVAFDSEQRTTVLLHIRPISE